MIGRDEVTELIKETAGNNGFALYITETLLRTGLNSLKYE